MLKLMWTLLLLMTAVATDVTSGRVSNRLIGLGMVTGIYFQIWESGIRGLFLSVIQIILPVIVLFLLFLMRALGAGDIKLFSMIGSIWNLEITFYCIIFSFLAGAVFSLTKLLYQKNLFARLRYFCHYIQLCCLNKSILLYNRHSDGKQNTIYFSISILIGFCITMGVIH